MNLPQIDIMNASPSIALIRAGVCQPDIAAALDDYFGAMTAYRAAQEAAQTGRVDVVPPNANAEQVAQLIVDANERQAAPDRAREALFGVLNAHYTDWEAATSKQLNAARTKITKLLGQLIEQLDTFHAVAGTAQGLAQRAQFQWRGYPEQNFVSEARNNAEAFLENLRATEAANRPQPDANPS